MSARYKHHLSVPRAPTRRLGRRRAAADRLVGGRIGHDVPALPCADINKSRLITRRRLRDMGCGHWTELNVEKKANGYGS